MSLLGVDIGTSGCKAVAFDAQGRSLASALRSYDLIRRAPGQAELPSREVWGKIQECIRACAHATAADPIEAISFSSMGEALVPVDQEGEICGDSLCGMDSRGEAHLARLLQNLTEREIYGITGNLPRPGFSLPALCWLKEARPEVYRRASAFLPWGDFAAFKLSGVVFANPSLASRTLLFDTRSGDWSPRMVGAAGLDMEKLPPILPSGRALGVILPKLADELGLGRGVIVVSGTHDQCAAALGSGARTPNTVMLGLGTFACAVLVHRETAADSVYRQLGLGIEAHAVAGQQVSFIFHGSGGALLKWLHDQFFRDLQGPDAYARMFEEIAPASRCPDVLPYFAASGPLDCAEGEQGAICGLSLAHTRGDILKGALEGIVLYFKEAFNELAVRGCKIERIHASGGGAESPLWLQMIADILQTPVVKPRNKECGALGAALLAGAGLGRFDLGRGGGASMLAVEREYWPASERGPAHDAALSRSLRIKNALSIGNTNHPIARLEPSCT